MPQLPQQVLPYAHAQPLGCVTSDELLSLQQQFPKRYPVLLQSAAIAANNQFDVLMAFPQQQLILTADRELQLPQDLMDLKCESFLEALDHWWRGEQTEVQASTLPFSGGWFLFLGYELATQIEPILRPMVSTYESKEKNLMAQAIRMPAAIVRNAITYEAWFVAEDEFASQCHSVAADIDQVRAQNKPLKHIELITNLIEESPEIFLTAVQRALHYISSGDIYQANLSRGWSATLRESISAQDIYRQLCAANPAPFAGIAILRDDEFVISSSPERLLSIRQGKVSTRPIAGTRPRSANQQQDAQLIDELRRNAKEQAEHVMLLDLERNDLGRICKAGSVRVDELMTVESYAHVHHIVSNVCGQLREEITPGQAIAAVFPGGTITGCPKVRCMQVIAELENEHRGVYTGSMGYLNRDGSLDLNILIRSLHVQNRKLSFRAGAGIVADSIPQQELEETRAKALGMLHAVGESC